MPTTTVIVHHERGLDARHAARLVEAVKGRAARVMLACGCRQADATSITGLLALGCTQGTPITLHAEGEEAEEALAAVVQLITSDFRSDP